MQGIWRNQARFKDLKIPSMNSLKPSTIFTKPFSTTARLLNPITKRSIEIRWLSPVIAP